MEQFLEQQLQRAAGSPFDSDTFLVREHVGFLKLHEAYDILTENGQTIATAVEEANALRKVLKLFISKNLLPFTVHIKNPNGQNLVTMRRGFTIFRSKVCIDDAGGRQIGYFQQHLLSIGGRFTIYDMNDQVIAQLKGNWIGWNFKFLDKNDVELGTVSRQWGGVAKELFTSADNYVVHFERSKLSDPAHIQILLAAAVCIDMVLKDKQGSNVSVLGD